jgi:predicted alpha/beta hydrolase family esterase
MPSVGHPTVICDDARVTERVCIVPRWAGRADSDWYPWIRAELAEAHPGLEVRMLDLPNPAAPVIDQCIASLRAELGDDLAALRETLLVGHSVGCQALMRYLAGLEPRSEGDAVEHLVCVAGWWTIDEPWPSLRPWVDTGFDLARLRRAVAGVSVLLGDDDPFTHDWRANQALWEQRLDARTKLVPGAKHFNASAEPSVLELIRESIR